MSDLLQIGASGVRAYQTALGTVGENIANAGVTGYSRRTVSLQEVAGASGTTAIRSDAGNGVAVGAIARSADGYASAAVRAAGSDLSRTETATGWLNRIEDALTGNEVTERTTAFFAASASLAADPSSTALRANVVGAATSAAAAYTATGHAFDQIESDFDTAAGQAAQTLSSLGASLARVNDGLGRTQPGTSAAAQLADQRDELLDQMSQIATVSSTTDAIGRAAVKLGGVNGVAFVQMTTSGTVGYQRNEDGTAAFTVHAEGTVKPLSTEGGSIAGLIEGAGKILAARQQIESVASGFASTVNAVQAGGDDVDGQPGQPMFATGARATDLSVALTDGSGVAAAARGTGPRNGDNLAALENLRIAKGFETSITAQVTDNATQIKQKQTIADAQTAIKTGAETVLSDATGVSLDSEAVDLMRFQQAYSASSRVIQVARETFQSILDIR